MIEQREEKLPKKNPEGKKSKKKNKVIQREAVPLGKRISDDKNFLIFIFIGIIAAAFFTGNRDLAMWFGFAFAAYSAVANDSIQSLGTFIESNKHRKWWVLWLFAGLIFVGTIAFSWIYFDGDVTYQRLLTTEGTTKYPHPEKFSYFQLIAPIVLLLITRLRMPVSTTFLLLSVFSEDSKGITTMITKSVSGYGLAFLLSFVIWFFGYRFIKKFFKSRSFPVGWVIVQWVVSGALWSVWVMQDGANIAVFLPRILNVYEFLVFTTVIFAGLGLLFYLQGDKIQEVVSEKTRIADVRAATLIDFTYVLLLLYKLLVSTVPMSTTWVFLGAIGGREIAISLARKKKGKKHKLKAMRVILRDLSYATIGLIISLLLAAGASPVFREEIFQFFRSVFNP